MKSHTEYFTFHTKKKRELGPWRQVFYAEFDGQRDKRLIVKLLGF